MKSLGAQQMTHEVQLIRWMNNESIHNTTRDECCPDFSCCQPSLKNPDKQRRDYTEDFLRREGTWGYVYVLEAE